MCKIMQKAIEIYLLGGQSEPTEYLKTESRDFQIGLKYESENIY